MMTTLWSKGPCEEPTSVSNAGGCHEEQGYIRSAAFSVAQLQASLRGLGLNRQHKHVPGKIHPLLL